MSDPLDDRLSDFATGTPAMNPVSPADVRRRGDRLRRRRTALAAAGAALAVALVAAPVAVLTARDGARQQRPARAPSTTTTLATGSAGAWVAGDVISVVLAGDSITVKKNGTVVTGLSAITVSQFNTQTRFGVGLGTAGATGVTYDDLTLAA